MAVALSVDLHPDPDPGPLVCGEEAPIDHDLCLNFSDRLMSQVLDEQDPKDARLCRTLQCLPPLPLHHLLDSFHLQQMHKDALVGVSFSPAMQSF